MTINDPFKYVYRYLGASGETPLYHGDQHFSSSRNPGVYIYEAFLDEGIYRKEILEQDLLSDPQLVIDTIRLELLFLA